jgi:hypothetical protein
VIRFLQKDGLPARTDLLEQINTTVASVWEGEPGVLPPDSVGARRRAGSGDVRWDREVGDRGLDSELR